MVHGIIYTMIVVPIDKAGRIVLPKEVRRYLHITGGDLLEIEMGPHEIHLRPRLTQPAQISRVNKRVVWDAPGSSASIQEIDQVIKQIRDERDSRIASIPI